MKTVGVIRANLTTSPIGTASRLAEELCGAPVLTRTLRQVSTAKRLDEIVVACPAAQHDQIQQLVDQSQVTIMNFDGPEYPASRTVRTARKWALESWRGGMGSSCFFDEHTHPSLCFAIANQFKADAVVSMPAEAPLIDPQLIDDMINHQEQHRQEARLVFAQAPPGLAPTIFETSVLGEIASSNLSPGWINSYRPNQPQVDMISKPICYRPPLAIQYAAGRLTSDTRRGFNMIERLIRDDRQDNNAETICHRLMAIRHTEPEPSPREIQIELTTADQHIQTLLRPRGRIVGERGPIEVDLFRQIIEGAVEYDDTLIVLGGFGEPLLHPNFAEILRICHEHHVFGLAVRTNGIALTEEIIHHLIDHDVDAIQIMLDATTPEKYQKVHGCDEWQTVKDNIDAFQRILQSGKRDIPIMPVSFVKARETFDDLNTFFDQWTSYTGWAVIEGYSHHAGLLEDRCVMSMSPPKRERCRQLRDRCTILSDGSVVACDQDFQGQYVAGNIREQSLSDIWQGRQMQSLRLAHREGRYGIHPMCETCDEWHRP